MNVEHVEFIVEEPSMEAFLRGILPRILGDLTFEVYPYSCKQELIYKMPERLRGYASWFPPTWRLIVVVDRDFDDCHKLKNKLENMAQGAGLVTKSQAAEGHFSVVNRIVVEELESWYFGDWKAVCEAFPRMSKTMTSKEKYRDPDAIRNAWEALERVLKAKGYFDGGLRKIELARTLSQVMAPERNRSDSFNVFYRTLTEMAAT